jgi:site-specific DNA-methyltransferase (adenine-specific)
MSVLSNLLAAFKPGKQFTLKEAYAVNPSYQKESVRARIYENLGKEFKKLSKGLYVTDDVVLIEGDGRDLSVFENESMDCIITDHPWDDKKSNNGGTRHLAQYDCFKYTLSDFMEKARVLKEGSFLVEILPAENENNFDYLYEIKKMAEQAGFKYYAKVAWKKGTFVSNTGRKAKNTEDIMIFSKGKPRALRPDKQRGVINGVPTRFMSGANGMLPTEFNVQAIPNKLKNVQTEKPVALFEQLLEYFTLPGELVLDQFAGSGVTGEACLNKKRKCILIEKCKEHVVSIINRLNLQCAVI